MIGPLTEGRLMRFPVMILTAVLFLFGDGARAEAPVRPVLVGIYAQNYDETVSWYKGNLGFETVNEVVNEGINLRIGFLDNGVFELEIYCDIVPSPKAERLSRDRFGMPSEGVVKLSVEARDIHRLAAALSANDVEFVQEIKESERKLGQSWFMVQDPDGNLIQVFGPTSMNKETPFNNGLRMHLEHGHHAKPIGSQSFELNPNSLYKPVYFDLANNR